MKRNLIAASVCLSVLLALGGCSNTGDVDGTNSSAPDASPSASTGVGNNNGGIPNNAGGTANNGGTNVGSGTGTDVRPGPSPSVTPNGGAGSDGDYNADGDGQVDGDGGAGTRSLIRDAEDAVKDMARDTGRAVRDVL